MPKSGAIRSVEHRLKVFNVMIFASTEATAQCSVILPLHTMCSQYHYKLLMYQKYFVLCKLC